MNILFLFYVIVIPILLVAFTIIFYNFHLKMSKAKLIIDTLSSTNSKILDKKRNNEIDLKKKRGWLRIKLDYAGFMQSGSEFMFIAISALFGFMIGFFIFYIVGNIIVFIISSIMFSAFPLLVLFKIIKSREDDFNLALKQMIDKITSMMKSGVGFEQALKKAVFTSKSQFARDVFNIYINEKAIIGEDKAFEKMFKYVNSKELRIFYLTISIGRQSGGKFSNTLEKLRKTLHDQGEIKQEITASTKEIKVGSYMIIGLVVSIYLMLNSSLDNKLNEHFFGTSDGKIQMFFISLWVMFGLFVNNLLTKVK